MSRLLTLGCTFLIVNTCATRSIEAAAMPAIHASDNAFFTTGQIDEDHILFMPGRERFAYQLKLIFPP